MVAGFNRETDMSIAISTDHFLLDWQGPTITAFGYEVSWLLNSVESDSGTEWYRTLMIERLDTRRTWMWTKEHGRWTEPGDGGDSLDGWM